jgi:Zn-dependent protease with chaperone function
MGWAGNEPPPELVDHVRKIAHFMGLPNVERINVFLTKGLTSMAFGSLWLPNGATIGLPRSVLFKNAEDVKGSFLGLTGKPIDWNSEMGRSLAASLLPSAQQINFVIAHEVGHLKHHDWLPRTVLPSVTLVIAYHASRAIPPYFVPHRSLAGFSLGMAVSLAIYLQLIASLSRWQEFRADKMAAQCSASYARGGLDHFSKRMKIDSVLK